MDGTKHSEGIMFEMLITAAVVGFVALGLLGHIMVAHALMTDRHAD
jgi:hypothetical protein